jgi:SAM-dependent methyltransferase
MKVIEVGSGLGILAAEVAAAAPDVAVVGVERSAEQLAAATRAPGVRYVRGDAHRLDFADGTFDLAYARYLLEHVADPGRALAEMRRVTRAGGRVAVLENDISLFRIDPPCSAFERVWAAFARYQERLGGDALVGRRLFRLFRGAGFTRIELSLQPETHWSGSPGFEPWVRNLVGNIESGRRGLAAEGFCAGEEIEAAIAELAALSRRDDASATFAWNRAAAVR